MNTRTQLIGAAFVLLFVAGCGALGTPTGAGAPIGVVSEAEATEMRVRVMRELLAGTHLPRSIGESIETSLSDGLRMPTSVPTAGVRAVFQPEDKPATRRDILSRLPGASEFVPPVGPKATGTVVTSRVESIGARSVQIGGSISAGEGDFAFYEFIFERGRSGLSLMRVRLIGQT